MAGDLTLLRVGAISAFSVICLRGTEGQCHARELIKGWQAPRKILMGVDNNTNRLAWLAASGGEDMWIIARENLKRYVAGDKLYSVVDPRRGW